MKKNKIFYFLFKSIIMFLLLFIIELDAFDTIKNFFNQGIENLKKGYRWITQKDIKIEDSQRSMAKIIKLPITNEENTKKKNNEDISIINQENNPKKLLREEKKSTKLRETLKKLMKNNSIQNFNNPDFKNKFIKKYNGHIEKKNQNKDNQEKISLLTEKEFNIILDNFKKKEKAIARKNNIRTAIKKPKIKNNNFDTLVKNLSSNEIIEEFNTESKIQEIENKNKEDENISNQVASLIIPMPINKTKKIKAIKIKKFEPVSIISEIKKSNNYIIKGKTVNNVLNEKLDSIVL